jgi:hypothetical protein
VSEALRSTLREQGGLLAELADELADQQPTGERVPQTAAAGPRTAARRVDYERLLELILQGSHLHYAPSSLEPDLALLLGDQLYALGLERLAEIGDLEAIAELADVISLVAQAQAAGDPALAQATWDAGGVAIGWGASGAHEQAKALARAGDPAAADALRGSASDARLDLDDRLPDPFNSVCRTS